MAVRTFVDAVGREHPPADSDARIVSLVPSLTELLFALGVEDRLVARTKYCVRPAGRIERVPTVGGTKNVDVEAVRELRPTHVILNVDENRRETADELARFVPHPIVTHPLSPHDNLELYRLFGGIFGAEERGEELSRRLLTALDELGRATAALTLRRVLYLIWRRPWMTVSDDTYIARTLALAGWTNVGGATADRYPRVDAVPEECELVLFSSEPYPFRAEHREEFASEFEVDPGRLLPIDGQIASWYGSRAIAGLEELGRIAAEVEERLAA